MLGRDGVDGAQRVVEARALDDQAVLVQGALDDLAARGIGDLLFEAISNRDFPLVQAVALYCAVFVVVISFLADLIAHWADPRTLT